MVKRGARTEPACWAKPCAASEIMLPELSMWIGLYAMLKSKILNGAKARIFRRAAVLDSDFEVLLDLDNVLNSWRIEQTKKK